MALKQKLTLTHKERLASPRAFGSKFQNPFLSLKRMPRIRTLRSETIYYIYEYKGVYYG